jgi:hypothetical protein
LPLRVQVIPRIDKKTGKLDITLMFENNTSSMAMAFGSLSNEFDQFTETEMASDLQVIEDVPCTLHTQLLS